MRRDNDLISRLLLPLILVAVATTWELPANAGCGCDHPPPAWSVVMPAFGSPGKRVAIFAEGSEFTVGQTYQVDFAGRVVSTMAALTDRVEVKVPSGVTRGPVSIRVQGPDYDVTYPESAFTVLSDPRRVRSREGVFHAPHYRAAVGSDGTLYLPLNVESVKDAMQFSFALLDVPLAYGPEDVVIYNADGVDLTLFTLDVDNPTERQWGSYYGWTVDQDNGLRGDWYEYKTGRSRDQGQISDIFTYWRHEFHTYANAHLPGGTHEVDANGLHPDGTRHIDHYNLVIAINGRLRDPSAPDNMELAVPLMPGEQPVHVGWLSIRTDNPIELVAIKPMMEDTEGPDAELLEEVSYQESN